MNVCRIVITIHSANKFDKNSLNLISTIKIPKVSTQYNPTYHSELTNDFCYLFKNSMYLYIFI